MKNYTISCLLSNNLDEIKCKLFSKNKMFLNSRNLISKFRLTCPLKIIPTAFWTIFSGPQVWRVQGKAHIILVRYPSICWKHCFWTLAPQRQGHCFSPINQCLDTSKVLVHIYWANTFISTFFTGLSHSSLWPLLQKVSKICKLVTLLSYLYDANKV